MICKICKIKFKARKERKFCSQFCYYKYRKIYLINTYFQKGHPNYLLFHTSETKKKMREAISKRREKFGYLNSLETRNKISKALRGRKLRLGKFWKEESKEKIRGKKNPAWNNGSSKLKYPKEWGRALRKSIRERDHYTCQLCGKEPSVYCHHIDYNKKNCNPINLITLCQECHAKTNNNRDYWLKYFHGKN